MGKSEVNVTLYIARHGECSGNVAQKFIDPFTDDLTPVGCAQAELLGKHLKDVPFTGAFSSDYPRAVQTAQAVLRESNAKENGVELITDVRLRERGYTGIIGMSAKDAVNIMYNAMQGGTPYLNVEMKNCETIEQFEERIVNFFTDLIERCRKSFRDRETILMVSHGLTIQRLMVLLNTRSNVLGITEWSNSRISERQMRNTTYHKLKLEISREQSGGISGCVEQAHCRDHVEKGSCATNNQVNVKDTGNYTFLEQVDKRSTIEEESVQYCTPV